MTGRTHDLAGFTALVYAVSTQPLIQMSFGTAIIAFSANMIGALAPDIDQPTAHLYRRMRGGQIFSRLISPLFGGHRYISHSIIGVIIFGYITSEILKIASSFLVVNQQVVWWAFMIGFVSHLIMDMFTEEGIPLLFPIPIKFGFPPFRFMRIKTAGIVEKSFIFPGLLLVNAYLIYNNYSKFLDFIRHYITR